MLSLVVAESTCFFALNGRASIPNANQYMEQIYIHHPNIYAVK